MTRLFDNTPATAEAELAAAIVAVEMYLAAEIADHPDQVENPISGWKASAMLVVQGVEPVRLRITPRWNRIERIRRGTHGFEGVMGL